jgi:hypothetical protein
LIFCAECAPAAQNQAAAGSSGDAEWLFPQQLHAAAGVKNAAAAAAAFAGLKVLQLQHATGACCMKHL